MHVLHHSPNDRCLKPDSLPVPFPTNFKAQPTLDVGTDANPARAGLGRTVRSHEFLCRARKAATLARLEQESLQ